MLAEIWHMLDLKENCYACSMHTEILNWQNCLLLDADKPPHAMFWLVLCAVHNCIVQNFILNKW
jgi:hypothetical protein